MPYEPFVSVVIPARDSAIILPECLLALRAQDFPGDRYEVIVVDDGSSDETAVIAAEMGARVVSIPPSGPAAARNRGVQEAEGDPILFTDADCVPDSGWIRALVDAFEDLEVAAAKGTYRSGQTSWTARFVQAEYESRYRHMSGRERIDFVDTYSAAYRRIDFESVGGFDESFPSPSVEDQELSFRLSRMGARMVFCPRAIVGHRHAADPVSYFMKKTKIGYWKMKVLARYPTKAVGDSHTPSSLKMEVLLMAACFASLPLGLVTGIFWLPLAFLGAHLAVSAPFCITLLRRDPLLAPRAPFFLVLRSIALGLGMVLGFVGPPFRSGKKEMRMERERQEQKSELLEQDA